MGIRSGDEYISSLRDGRTIYVNGERIKDVTAYAPFRGVVATMASLYDLQHQHREALTYSSPKTGEPVSTSFLMATTVEEVEARIRSEEMRAQHTLGLMGRMPIFATPWSRISPRRTHTLDARSRATAKTSYATTRTAGKTTGA